ncbi:uncharacterized protein LOC109613527 [Musca domestica]|uniref:Uncharacterized protein LOC109613527 n=1 Tax=Musca domestica TaxID=7370 RepID=A0A9J7IF27_MUSDO|nr:uncharacterized protein LOC109613527 [Musca domestica]
MHWLAERTPYFGLALMAAYGAYEMLPDVHPYAFTASAFGIVFGIYGMVGGRELRCSLVKSVLDTTMDIVPLSLMNIEIFLQMGEPYAMAHALFIIPLILDFIAKLFGDETDEESTQILKYVNTLANVVSLSSLAYREDNYLYGCVAISILAAQTSSVVWGGPCRGYRSEFVHVMGYSMFYFASIMAITVPNVAIKGEIPTEIKKEAV